MRYEAGGGVANTSGQGPSAVVPEEIKGWNWAGFVLGWLWALGNGLYLYAVLGLLPIVNLVIQIMLGLNGNEYAWRARRWDSVEHFKRTQRTWTRATLIYVVGSIILTCICIALVVLLSENSTAP